MRADLFSCLPRPTALLLLSSILELTNAHVLQPLPRPAQAPTTSIPYQALNVVSWPLRPTPPPRDRFALRRRQDNTVCGYIGGSSDLPATCSAGSHCVLDTEHNVVGCCPNGEASCTAGVFTGCVDANSGPQTEVNPYVYSCTGSAVCYKNVFEGGFSQFGCGTASDQATVVLASASGMTALLDRPTVTVSYTQGISTLSEPTTLGTVTGSGITSGTSSPSSSLKTTASSSLSPTPASSSTASTVTAGPAATTSADISTASAPAYRTGAIVGGTIGGLAVLVAVVSLAVFFIRRGNSNTRQGPGPGGVRGKHISAPLPGPGTGFAALAQDSDAFETGPGGAGLGGPSPNMAVANRDMLPPIATTPPLTQESLTADDHTRSPLSYGGGAGTAMSTGVASSVSPSSYPPSSSEEYHYPGQYPAAYAGGAGVMMMRGNERLESDQVPLTRELDDFSQGFHAALGRIGEEDEEEAYQDLGRSGGGGQEGGHDVLSGGAASPHHSSGSGRPLWQQNRRQSRNLMWM
ncbi:hypothetical protein VTK56DRAFT_4444 [Thermocarpiscus australiensis]